MFAARKLLAAVATATKSNVSLRPTATPLTVNRRDFTTTVNTKYIPELAVNAAKVMLLDRMSHTLCKMQNREKVLEAVTLTIPGTADIKKEGTGFRVFLDLKANRSDKISAAADVHDQMNALFLEAEVVPAWPLKQDSVIRRYNSRVNLEKNDIIYECGDIHILDGGIEVTLHEYSPSDHLPPFGKKSDN